MSMDNQDYKFRTVGLESVVRLLGNTVKSKLSERPFLLPIMPTLYVTFGCNLSCSFCDHPTKRAKLIKPLGTDETLELVEKIKPGNQILSVTGGEPLTRRDITQILQKARDVGFKPLFLNTNAYFIDQRPDVLKLIDYVSISLDDLDFARWDQTLGKKGASERIIQNIISTSKLRETYGFKMAVNAVLLPNPESLRGFRRVLDFCREYNIPVSPGPVDVNGFPDERFKGNAEYVSLIDEMIEMKKTGSHPLASSPLYLQQIRDFKRHDCFPTQMPRVFPDGSVPIPCEPMGREGPFKYNLRNYISLNELLRDAYDKDGLPPCVRNTDRCVMPCHMTPTNATQHPIDLIKGMLGSI